MLWFCFVFLFFTLTVYSIECGEMKFSSHDIEESLQFTWMTCMNGNKRWSQNRAQWHCSAKQRDWNISTKTNNSSKWGTDLECHVSVACAWWLIEANVAFPRVPHFLQRLCSPLASRCQAHSHSAGLTEHLMALLKDYLPWSFNIN